MTDTEFIQSTHVEGLFCQNQLTWQRLLALIQDGETCSYIKINHGFWETLIKCRHIQKGSTNHIQRLADEKVGREYFLETGFRDELVSLLQTYRSNCRPNKFLAASPYAFPGSPHWTGSPFDEGPVIHCMKEHLPSRVDIHDGLMWKWMVLDYGLEPLIEVIQKRPVFCIGPPHLEALKSWFSGPFEHIVIPYSTARKDRNKILDHLCTTLQNSSEEGIALFQAGSLAPWLIEHLDRKNIPITLLDMGRVLDLADAEVLAPQPWFSMHQAKMLKHIRSPKDFRPGWHKNLSSHVQRLSTAALPFKASGKEALTPIPFLENKFPCWEIVQSFLFGSSATNRWTNFGPANGFLEQTISQFLGLPCGKTVIMTSNGTTALSALTALYGIKLGKNMRWAIPSFTFQSSEIAARGNAIILDCDASGMLDLTQLDLFSSEIDGLIVTNLFGFDHQMKPYIEWARKHGVPLLIDNATGLDGARKDFCLAQGEMISFHHTKPWGVGEGGCMVVSADDEELARSLINFGATKDVPVHLTCNGKLSDFAAAHILDRLYNLPAWKPYYRWQYWRISTAAEHVGFRRLDHNALSINDSRATSSHVPLVSPYLVSKSQLSSFNPVLRKYYSPLRPTPTASSLFSTVFCVPCHSGLAALSNKDLIAFFHSIMSKLKQ